MRRSLGLVLAATATAAGLVGLLAIGPALASGPRAPAWPVIDRGPQQPRHAAPVYVVRPGDTLWAIAARHLPGRPAAAAGARAWPRGWRANTGPVRDPDLIRPGQRLRVPAARP